MDDLDRALDTWRAAHFIVTLDAFTLPTGAERTICRIYQGLVPHSWETRGVYVEGFDRRETIVAALRQAAATYPRVV